MADKNEAASKQDTAATKTEPVINNSTVIRYRGKEDDDLAGAILTWFIQVTGLAAAVTFGIFSVLSWTTAQDAKHQANTAIQQADTANQEAKMANLLALAALCGNTANEVSLLLRLIWQNFIDWHRRTPHTAAMFASFVVKYFLTRGLRLQVLLAICFRT